MILIDQIEQDRAAGVGGLASHRSRRCAVCAHRADRSCSRCNMIPLSRSVFRGPMAVGVMGGLIVATDARYWRCRRMYAAWFRVGRDCQTGDSATG